MFEVGRRYTITTIEAGNNGWTDEETIYTIAEVDGTLIRVESGDFERIINVSSWTFVGAERYFSRPRHSV